MTIDGFQTLTTGTDGAAPAAEEEHWIRQAQLADNGQDIDGQQQRNLVLLFGPTAVGKTTEVKMQAIGRDKKVVYQKRGKQVVGWVYRPKGRFNR